MPENIKTFFAILFYSKTILLTPQPVNLGREWTEIRLSAPLVAVTPGAALYADIGDLGAGPDAHLELQKPDSSGLIVAKLIDAAGKETILTYRNGISFTKKASGKYAQELILQAGDGGVPIQTEFTRLLIRSERALPGVRITWQNYSQ